MPNSIKFLNGGVSVREAIGSDYKSAIRGAYKRVVILGPDLESTAEFVKNKFPQPDDETLVISDGINPVTKEQIAAALTGKITGDTEFVIHAHGIAHESQHYIQLYSDKDTTPTRTFFNDLRKMLDSRKRTRGQPFRNINLFSCYGGIAQNDVLALGKGSTVIAYSQKDKFTYPRSLYNFLEPSTYIRAQAPTGNPAFDSVVRHILSDHESLTIANVDETGTIRSHTSRPQKKPILNNSDLRRYLTEDLVRSFYQHLKEQHNIRIVNNNGDVTALDAALVIPQIPEEVLKQYMSGDFIQAAAEGKFKKVQKYIDSHFDINSTDLNGEGALIIAAQNNHTDVVDQLLRAGANVDKPTIDGTTALIFAANNGHTVVVAQLLGAGANVDYARPKDGFTALYAAQNGNTEVTDQLLRAGANVDKPTLDGTTALMFAAYNGKYEAYKKLVDAGANEELRCRGYTAKDIAKQQLDAVTDPQMKEQYSQIIKYIKPAPSISTSETPSTSSWPSYIPVDAIGIMTSDVVLKVSPTKTKDPLPTDISTLILPPSEELSSLPPIRHPTLPWTERIVPPTATKTPIIEPSTQTDIYTAGAGLVILLMAGLAGLAHMFPQRTRKIGNWVGSVTCGRRLQNTNAGQNQLQGR